MKAALKSLEQCPFLDLDSDRTLDQLLIQVTGGPSMGMASVQRLIASLRERLNCRESIRFGASIDADAGDAMRVCLLGKMEIGKANSVPVVDSRDTSLLFPGGKEDSDASELLPVHTTKLQKRKAAKKQSAATEQEEFDFITDNSVQRGLFEKSERNFYGDEDLDVPTFMRKGVRIRIL